MQRSLRWIQRGLVTLGLAAVAGAAPNAHSQPADSVVQRAVNAWSKVRTARGSFEQNVTNPLTRSSATARGTFQQQRPNRIAIRFTDPRGDAIIADGNAVWIYLPSTAPGQVIKRPATDRSAVPIDLVGQFLDDPRGRYQITDAGQQAVDGRPARMLRLVPKAGTAAPFTRATVWVDDADGLIRQFEVVESSGITRRIRMTTLTVNRPNDNGAFTFSVPRGARVIDQTGS
jgi:outer membrane lipoprotein carrier protein